MDIEYVRSRFIKHFDGTTGSVYASPGRINLIGEHTDYNGGFVFPGAVDKGYSDLGVDAIILGCTELPMVYGDVELKIPTLDATKIHIQNIIDEILR